MKLTIRHVGKALHVRHEAEKTVGVCVPPDVARKLADRILEVIDAGAPNVTVWATKDDMEVAVNADVPERVDRFIAGND